MLLLNVVLALTLISTCLTGKPSTSCPNCNDGCHMTDPDKLNIHLVPHTHDDAGWLKTIDQYYYRTNNYYARGGVQHIIDSVLAELAANPDRRFVYVESSFLHLWWNDRNTYYHNLIRKLVNEGRLQLLHGGWVMSDEATPHYTMMIDQMTLGLQFLRQTFGDCGIPKVAWQIDPFGHSAEATQEFIDMGFEGVFYGRIDQADYEQRKLAHALEMIWNVNPQDHHMDTTIFTGILYNLYHPPPGFCFDIMCNDEGIVDKPGAHDYNVDRIVASFIEKVKVWTLSYKGNHVMVPMGGDFTYMMAGTWFVNMDRLIKYANEQPEYHVNLIYSTPLCYMKALKEGNISWPVKMGEDFFPYRSQDNMYWTGYFSSRPSLKLLTMKSNNLLQAVKQIDAVMFKDMSVNIYELEKVVALLQHHDAITGTAKQHVTNDYLLYLSETIIKFEDFFTAVYRQWTGQNNGKQVFCLKLNVSECDITERYSKFIVHLYNPLSISTNAFIRLPVRSDSVHTVLGETADDKIEYEILPLSPELQKVPGRESRASHELFFEATQIPPMGMRTFYVEREWAGEKSNPPLFPDYIDPKALPNPNNDEIVVTLENGLALILNPKGLLQFIEIEGERFDFGQTFGYYTSRRAIGAAPSGAYIFSPYKYVELNSTERYTIYKGENIVEIHQVFNHFISQVICLHRKEPFVEFNWQIGPIDISEHEGKEVITKYKTAIKNEDQFYTDSNGRRFIKRMKSKPQVEANYYPVTTGARIEDSQMTLTVLTDRAQGATSPEEGHLELMLHRRLLTDDGKGVGEALNEKAYDDGLVVRGRHIVFLQKSMDRDEISSFYRTTSKEIAFVPWLSITSTFYNATQWYQSYIPKVNFLNSTALPLNIHVLTLQKRSIDHVLLRLEHYYDHKEHSVLSKEATVNLQMLLPLLTITEVEELTLGANQEKKCVSKMEWNNFVKNYIVPPPSTIIIMRPMEIRTFILTVHRHFQFPSH